MSAKFSRPNVRGACAYAFYHIRNEAALKERPARVTFVLEPHGQRVRLTLTQEGFAEQSVVVDGVPEGWPAILSGLKSLLETGAYFPKAAFREPVHA